MTKKICVVDTVYTLFLYFLINGVSSDDLFIFSTGIPKSVRDNIKHIYVPVSSFKFKSNESLIKFVFTNLGVCFKHIYSILKLRFLMFFIKGDVSVYGHAHTLFSYMLYEYENACIIEDGTANYQKLESNFISNKLLNFLGFYFRGFKSGFGTHKNIKKVYLTSDKPCDVSSKVEVINLEKLWNELSSKEQNTILKFFNFNDYENIDVLLITQPFSEDETLGIDEEIRIYSEIVEKYPNIVIKPHPREFKDYSKIFPNISVLDKDFPLELFDLIGVKVRKVVTVSSTAVTHFQDSEIEIYDGVINSDFELRESLMKLIWRKEFIDILGIINNKRWRFCSLGDINGKSIDNFSIVLREALESRNVEFSVQYP